MLGFAEKVFRLAQADKAGVTMLEKLEHIERTTGKRPPALDLPDIPPCAAHVWYWFQDLSAARGNSGFGPLPISFQEILAWVVLTGTQVRPWEARLIRSLDSLWMSLYRPAQEA